MRYASPFTNAVQTYMRHVPFGKVVTYGQVAAEIGHPKAARQVGGTAHFGDPDIPWHRLVNRFGGVATGYPGGPSVHREHLEVEGITGLETEKGWCIDLQTYQWRP